MPAPPELPVPVAARRPAGRGAAGPVALLVVAALGLGLWFGDPLDRSGAQGGADRPTPRAAASEVPLGALPPAPVGEGRHAFSMLQPGSAAPVAYDPCRPVPVVVNDDAAPPGSTQLVEEALAAIGDATGLVLVVEGGTDEVAGEDRPAFQPERYGDRWAPVLVAWSDPAAHPPLAGDVAGIGGSTAVSTADAGWVYVTGSVVLDAAQIADVGRGPGGYRRARAVVVHELAHVVGLDHVDDPTHLMHPSATAVTDLHAGDRAGLAALGRGTCPARL